MGKLHTLKRAIERNPEMWVTYSNGRIYPRIPIFFDGQWIPYNWLRHYSFFINRGKQDKSRKQYKHTKRNRNGYTPYRNFMISQLRKLGYDF